MKYVELNLFLEEEDEVQRISAPNDSKEQVSSTSRDYDLTDLFAKLSKSSFRSRFRLSAKDKEYVASKGLATIRQHAEDFVARRLAPAVIPNDGKQTPMRGHPVFIAQHATGCCCRGCFSKWHHIPAGRQLTMSEQQYAVAVIMSWIERQI
ncbi:DUF4186 domain-containing protein [Prevotella sp.]|uniref:DUF4186 domain-containing protein n=1 Tax=uncultured Prevotella sp. TaxID=159272 RepID=UPI0027E294B0|nr:DUF4186 domain-containing protein [uncultured Prevotella sp.]